MATARQDLLLGALPVPLQARAVDLSDEGSTEYAFPIECSAEVFEILREAGFAILGGDLWRMAGSGFCPGYESWFVNASSEDRTSAWNSFLAQFRDDSECYVTFVY
jgi:hypothetical protein